MTTTLSPAQRTLSDFQTRGVKLELIKNNARGSDSIVSPYEIQMTGGRLLPGDWDKVKRFKSGLVALLLKQGAHGMALSDWETATVPQNFALLDPRKLGPQYKDKAGDEKVSPELSTAELVFAPMGKTPTVPSLKKAIAAKPQTPKPEPKVKSYRPSLKSAHNRCPIVIGGQYKAWTVLSEIGRKKGGYIEYECQCVCGKVRSLEGSRLLREGVSKSCGCLNKYHVDHKWSETDWTKTNVQLSKDLKCAANTVSYYREKLAPETMPRKGKIKHHD